MLITEEHFQRLETFIRPPKLTSTPWPEAVQKSLEGYRELKRNGTPPGLMTGFEKFDYDTGGLRKGSLNVIVAETGGCKSTVATNIMNHVAVKKKKPVACFSYEMQQDEFVDMLFSINAHIDRNLFNTGRFSDADQIRMENELAEIVSAPLFIYDMPATVEDLEEACVQMCAGVPLELIVVDYLQLVTPTNVRDIREQQIAHVSRSLKRMAARLKCPVLALSQLNEEGKVRESRAIAHDANLILKVVRDGDHITLEIAKGRRVAAQSYTLDFAPRFCRVQ